VSSTRDFAKRLRKDATGPERVLWSELRNFRASGYHFRRQASVGKYIADFVCFHAKLIVEADGDQHGLTIGLARDETRDAWLRSQGFIVMRFSNWEILNELESVVLTIQRELETRWRAPRYSERAFDRQFPKLREWMASRGEPLSDAQSDKKPESLD
jgi:very-short-patch-repair endonuclease